MKYEILRPVDLCLFSNLCQNLFGRGDDPQIHHPCPQYAVTPFRFQIFHCMSAISNTKVQPSFQQSHVDGYLELC